MRIGVPREVKNQERRVALTPAGVDSLRRLGHDVLIETGAGVGAGFDDLAFSDAGATIVSGPSDAWSTELVVKVKEPLKSEYAFLRPDLTLFTYLHLAADADLADALCTAGTTAIAYETVQLPDRSLPLLAPMSEVAGRLSVVMGAHTH